MLNLTAKTYASPQSAYSSMSTVAFNLDGQLRSGSEGQEELGQLTETTVELLQQSGLTGLLVPRELGGQGASLLEAIEALESVSRSDAATGWVLMATQAAASSAAAYLPEEGAAQVFSGKVPIIAGQGAPNGKASVCPGGYMLQGRWNFGSGVKHSEFLHTGAVVTENGQVKRLPNGEPERLIFILPTEAATLEGNWNVLGLRATGSVDYSLNNVFVPASHTHNPASLSVERGQIFGVGLMGLASLGHTAWALGIGQRALDELQGVVASKAGGPAFQLGESETFQQSYAEVAGEYLAARALVYDTWKQFEQTVTGGATLSQRQLTLMRLTLNYATSAAVRASELGFQAAGGVGLRHGPVQQCFRDAYSGAQHIMVSPSILRDCGRELLGYAGERHWSPRGLA